MSLGDWIPSKSDFLRFRPNPYQFRRLVVRLSISLIVILLILLAIGGLFIYLQVFINIPSSISGFQLLDIGGSLLLSLALVYLYFQQKEILASRESSRISVNRFLDGEEDVIDILVSNSGSGPIHTLILKVDIEYSGGELEGGTTTLGLYTEENGERRRFVKPFESSTSFKKKLLLHMKLPNEESNRMPPFHMAMSLADRYGISEGHLTMTLLWEDSLRTGEIELFDEDIEIQKGQTFAEFISLYPKHYRGV